MNMEEYDNKAITMILNGENFLLELFIKGIFVEGESNIYLDLKEQDIKRYRRFDFYLNDYRYSTYIEEEDNTPYKFADGKLYYCGELLPNIAIQRIEKNEWGSESSWYIKRKNNIDNRSYELRLNPINMCANLKYTTGENGEYRGCAFCHRVYMYGRMVENRKVIPMGEIFNEIFVQEGTDILKNVKKVLIMTGNVNNTRTLLNLCKETYDILRQKDFHGVFSISTNQICTENDIKELASIDNTIFDYTLEIFERRECLMGKKKGYGMEKVIEVLTLARRYFKYIRITYIVGLDNYDVLKKGFMKLKSLNLIDDVIPLIFVPYTPEMKRLRIKEATETEYYIKVKNLFQNINLVPLKKGLAKNLFQEDKLNNNEMDGLLEGIE